MAAYSDGPLLQSPVQRQTQKVTGRGGICLLPVCQVSTADLSIKKATPCEPLQLYEKTTGNGVIQYDEK